jgi:hypothetical protein
MKVDRTRVRIALQHRPVSMPGHQGDLFDAIAGFEQAADAFMPQVVEM